MIATIDVKYGIDTQLGAALVADPRIKGVGFTGSRAGGTALMRIAAFGPASLLVRCRNLAQLREVAESLEGQLTACVHMEAADLSADSLGWLARCLWSRLLREIPREIIGHHR